MHSFARFVPSSYIQNVAYILREAHYAGWSDRMLGMVFDVDRATVWRWREGKQIVTIKPEVIAEWAKVDLVDLLYREFDGLPTERRPSITAPPETSLKTYRPRGTPPRPRPRPPRRRVKAPPTVEAPASPSPSPAEDGPVWFTPGR